MSSQDLVRVARGEEPADLILKNCRVVNTLAGEIEEADIAILGDTIAGVGSYDNGRRTIDLKNAYVAPGLINGHTHIESSMLHPARYSEAVIPRGTLTVITDLHEIANVCGEAGIRFCMRWGRSLPLDMKFMAPSCVPATPLETSGASFSADAIRTLLKEPDVIGLGEMMNYPGVLAGIPDVLDKIAATAGKPIDGHAPGVRGHDLDAYIAAGIMSDHECTVIDEAREKLHKGMHIMIREGSSEKNLEALLPLVTDLTYPRCMFVVDDRNAADLDAEGDIDHVVRKAIQLGLDPIRAVQLATINPARYFRLHDRGSISPGKRADLITLRELTDLSIDKVFYRGKMVAEGGVPLFQLPSTDAELTDTVRTQALNETALSMPSDGSEFPLIELIPGQIVTKKRFTTPAVSEGCIVPDTGRDILKLVVVERHAGTGNIGKGLVTGFGLKKGALASSVAHDSHNLIAVGTTDHDIVGALNALIEMQGGLVVFADGKIQAALPLPVAGLLSPAPLQQVLQQMNSVQTEAHLLGTLPQSPFSLLSFLALPVIPELRLTDLGVVDVTEFRIISHT
ncbi:MAG: adenine deaminase [Dehalococcoidia bacterium]|nr:adenine deaminase [Dehalococcoidia bacterium]